MGRVAHDGVGVRPAGRRMGRDRLGLVVFVVGVARASVVLVVVRTAVLSVVAADIVVRSCGVVLAKGRIMPCHLV